MTSSATPETTTQVYRVYIKATPEAIWEAITKPEWTEKYFYGSRASYELRPGGRYESRGLAGEGDDVMVDGEVVEVDPPRRLVQTWRATWLGELATRITWDIREGQAGVSTLTVTHDVTDAPNTAAQVSGAIEGAGGGWNEVLSGLKTLLETGKPLFS
ncbi:SRPBCC family protein [Micromonospora sp. NPDC049559]|uniref:SRPBCC family protein n=1 Tax=Micromonospora sp. NPDC049559 TaxID=3155923 RepID=UPI0034246ACC